MDRTLVAPAQAGDQDAYTALATEAARPVYLVAYRILRDADADAAEDAAQSALVAMWRELRTLQASGATRADGTPAVRVFLMDSDGSESRLRDVPGDDTSQTFLRWSADGRSLLVRVKDADSTRFPRQPMAGTWHGPRTRRRWSRPGSTSRRGSSTSRAATPLQSWMSASDLAWQPLPPAPAE